MSSPAAKGSEADRTRAAEGSGTRPIAPSGGTLNDTPLSHVLAYIRNKRLSGCLDLHASPGREAHFAFWRGLVVSALTTPVVARFGAVVYELGWIDGPTLDEVTVASSERRTPVGDILLGLGAITPEQRDEVLAEQTRRRVHHAFTFPPDTAFTFTERAPAASEPALAVDVLASLWRGIVDFRPEAQISQVLEHVGDAPIAILGPDPLDRVELSDSERALCEALAVSPMTIRDLQQRFEHLGERVDPLVYFLVITDCATLANRRPDPRPEAAASGVQEGAPRRRSFELSCMKASIAPRLAARARIVSPRDLGAAGIIARASGLAFESAYETLGLPESAPPEAARAAYVRLSRLWHPDHLPSELHAVRSDAARIWTHIAAAYDAITNTSPSERTETDD